MSDSETAVLLQKLVESPLNPCFGCSPFNTVGLHLRVEQNDRGVQARFVPCTEHQGWAGVIHGGILATLLDEVMAYPLYYRGLKGVTARMEIRYRAPARILDSLIAEAQITKESRRLVDVRGRIKRDDHLIAEATGRFVLLGYLDPSVLSR